MGYPFWEGASYDYDTHIAYLEELDRKGELSRVSEHRSLTAGISSDSYIWPDVRRTDVLNGKLARDNKDERHICPLQLDLIKRCILRWSNPGERVLDYFAGIGSVPYVAVQHGRYGIGFELAEKYYRWSVKFLEELDLIQTQMALPGFE